MIIQRRTDNTRGVIFGIDQSYTGFAVAVLNYVGNIGQSVQAFKAEKTWTTADNTARLLRMETWFESRVDIAKNMGEVRAVVMEGYARGRVQGREESGELSAMIRRVLWQNLGMSPVVVAPTSLKKFVVGTGKAEKSDIKLAVYKRYGFETRNDNIADAVGLAYVGHALVYGDDGLTVAQRDVLKVLGNDQSWRLSRTDLLALQFPDRTLQPAGS